MLKQIQLAFYIFTHTICLGQLLVMQGLHYRPTCSDCWSQRKLAATNITACPISPARHKDATKFQQFCTIPMK